jgi:hypothetical protein
MQDAHGRCTRGLPSFEQGGFDKEQIGNTEMKWLQRVAFIGNHLPRGAVPKVVGIL